MHNLIPLSLVLLLATACSPGASQTNSTTEKTIIVTDQAPAAIGVYSQGIRVGNTIYVSGQLGLDSQTGELVGDDLESQVRQAIDNIETILSAEDYGLEDIVSVDVFLDDLDNYSEFNSIYIDYFTQDFPARMVVEAARIPLDAKIEIKVIAAK